MARRPFSALLISFLIASISFCATARLLLALFKFAPRSFASADFSASNVSESEHFTVASVSLSFRSSFLDWRPRQTEFGEIYGDEGGNIAKSGSVGHLAHRVVTSIMQFRALDLMASILVRLHTMLDRKH